MVRALRAFLEFCYIVRRNVINKTSLIELKDALTRFHCYRKIFETTGACPNGLCYELSHSGLSFSFLSFILSYHAP